MNARSVTLAEAHAALDRAGYPVIGARIPCDLDGADIALSQARAILDLLTVACDGIDIGDTYPGTLVGSLYAALAEVNRAREELFGPRQVRL